MQFTSFVASEYLYNGKRAVPVAHRRTVTAARSLRSLRAT
jgi:hypothetical protein